MRKFGLFLFALALALLAGCSSGAFDALDTDAAAQRLAAAEPVSERTARADADVCSAYSNLFSLLQADGEGSGAARYRQAWDMLGPRFSGALCDGQTQRVILCLTEIDDAAREAVRALEADAPQGVVFALAPCAFPLRALYESYAELRALLDADDPAVQGLEEVYLCVEANRLVLCAPDWDARRQAQLARKLTHPEHCCITDVPREAQLSFHMDPDAARAEAGELDFQQRQALCLELTQLLCNLHYFYPEGSWQARQTLLCGFDISQGVLYLYQYDPDWEPLYPRWGAEQEAFCRQALSGLGPLPVVCSAANKRVDTLVYRIYPTGSAEELIYRRCTAGESDGQTLHVSSALDDFCRWARAHADTLPASFPADYYGCRLGRDAQGHITLALLREGCADTLTLLRGEVCFTGSEAAGEEDERIIGSFAGFSLLQRREAEGCALYRVEHDTGQERCLIPAQAIRGDYDWIEESPAALTLYYETAKGQRVTLLLDSGGALRELGRSQTGGEAESAGALPGRALGDGACRAATRWLNTRAVNGFLASSYEQAEQAALTPVLLSLRWGLGGADAEQTAAYTQAAGHAPEQTLYCLPGSTLSGLCQSLTGHFLSGFTQPDWLQLDGLLFLESDAAPHTDVTCTALSLDGESCCLRYVAADGEGWGVLRLTRAEEGWRIDSNTRYD